MGGGEDHRQVGALQLLLIFCQGLVHQFYHVHGGQVHRNAARGGLGHFHQVLGQLLKPLGLAGQDLQILLSLGWCVGLLKKVHIIHNGGQGGFRIVGHIGDKFGFHALGLQLPLHGRLAP